MKILKPYSILFILANIMLSCTHDLEDEISKPLSEYINGFDIHWRLSATAKQKNVARDIISNMVFVEGGCFAMGATPEQDLYARKNEYPLCYVELSGFYICRYEITDEQFVEIVGNNQQYNSNQNLHLTWADFELFFKALSEITSLRFDFPTEAQWEFAARGGNLSNGYVFPGSNDIDKVNSYDLDKGSLVPNELGIYNLADKKAEWCKDYYTDYDGNYYHNRCISTGKYHVVRGGHYQCSGWDNYHKETLASAYGYGYFSIKAGEYDLRYCRITARSYGYNTTRNYITSRAVINP